MQKVKLGVIGCGSIAEIAHFSSIEGIPEAELVAVCDASEETVRQAASKWKARAYFTDYLEMLTRENLDAVVIATPNSFHRDQALVASQAGVHVLVEKPMAITNRKMNNIVKVAKLVGVSTATVSKVFNNDEKISKKTREQEIR